MFGTCGFGNSLSINTASTHLTRVNESNWSHSQVSKTQNIYSIH